MKLLRSALFALVGLSPFIGAPAHAANYVLPCYNDTASPPNCVPTSAATPLPVNAVVNASITPFAPNGNVATLAVTNSSGNVALPAGAAILVSNVGTTNTAYVSLSVGAGTATTSSIAIPPGGAVGFATGSNTYLNAITASSTTTLNIAGGAGLVAGYGGGGGSGGGSSGAVYGPTANGSPAANPPVLLGGTSTGGAAGNVGNLKVDSSGNAYVVLSAGTNVVGVVGNAQGSTTSGQSGPLVQGAVTTGAPSYTTAQTSPLSLDTSGNLRVNVVAGGGTGGTSVAQGSTTSGQNVSPMGCRTLTSAPTDTTAQTNMPSCDTAGALRINVATSGYSQGSTTSGQNLAPIGCRTLSSAPTDTTAQTNIPRCTTSGELAVSVTSGGAGNAAASATGSAVPSSGSYNATNVGGTLRGQTGVNPSGSVYAAQNDVTSVNGTTVLVNTGATGAGSQRVTVATDTATIAGSQVGTAGSPATTVVSVQGVSSGTAVPVSSGVLANASATSQTYSPIATISATNCNAASGLTNTNLNSPNSDLQGNICARTIPFVATDVSGSGSATSTTSTQCVALVSSKSLYITSFDFTNSNASSFVVTLQDGSGGTALWSGLVPAGGGIVKTGPTPLLHTSSGNGLYFAVATGGSTVYCNASGFSQ